MADKIDKFIELVEEKIYKKIPFSIVEHIKSDEEQRVMFKVTLMHKANIYRCIYFEKFEDIHDVMFDLEELADHVANGFYRELSSKIKETKSEEE